MPFDADYQEFVEDELRNQPEHKRQAMLDELDEQELRAFKDVFGDYKCHVEEKTGT